MKRMEQSARDFQAWKRQREREVMTLRRQVSSSTPSLRRVPSTLHIVHTLVLQRTSHSLAEVGVFFQYAAPLTPSEAGSKLLV